MRHQYRRLSFTKRIPQDIFYEAPQTSYPYIYDIPLGVQSSEIFLAAKSKSIPTGTNARASKKCVIQTPNTLPHPHAPSSYLRSYYIITRVCTITRTCTREPRTALINKPLPNPIGRNPLALAVIRVLSMSIYAYTSTVHM